MKTANITLHQKAVAARTRKSRRIKPLDVMVTTVGLTVALGGFFSREITWALAGA